MRATGGADESIIELSRNPPRIILTEDKDFGEWVFAHNISGISVIFLRYAFRETENISEILIRLLKEVRRDCSVISQQLPPKKFVRNHFCDLIA